MAPGRPGPGASDADGTAPVASPESGSGQAMVDPIERLAGARDLGSGFGLGLVGAVEAVGDLGGLGVRLLGRAFDGRLQIGELVIDPFSAAVKVMGSDGAAAGVPFI